MSFPAGFPQADGSVIYENARKIEVYVKGQPMYEWEPAEEDLVCRQEQPWQVRIWWEDYVPAMLGESAEGGSLAGHRQSANANLGAPSESGIVLNEDLSENQKGSGE